MATRTRKSDDTANESSPRTAAQVFMQTLAAAREKRAATPAAREPMSGGWFRYVIDPITKQQRVIYVEPPRDDEQ